MLWIDVLSEKIVFSPAPVGPPPQPVWNRPRLSGRSPLKHGVSCSASDVVPWSSVARPGTARRSTVSSASIGVAVIQCFCWICSLVSLSESACSPTSGIHQAPSKRSRRPSAFERAHRSVASSPLDCAMSARS